MKLRLFLVGAFMVCFYAVSSAQITKLAQQYFRNGEYEKAAELYEQLYKEQPYSDFYFTRYLETLTALQDFSKAEKLLKKRIKKYPQKTQLYVDYGNLYEQQYKSDKAKAKYEEAIGKLSAERYQIIRLANAFIKLTKYDLALKTYERGGKILKDKYIFAYELGGSISSKRRVTIDDRKLSQCFDSKSESSFFYENAFSTVSGRCRL